MADPKGLQQQFNNIITKISFAGGGLVVFAIKWNAGYSDDTPPHGNLISPPAMPNIRFDFSDSNLDIDTFNIMDQGKHNIVPDELDKKEKDKQVPIKNPVTLDMMAHYAAWTPEPVDTKTTTTPGKPTETWIWDLASYQLVYAHHITSRITPPLSRDDALAQFKGLIGSTGYEGLDPELMGVIIEQVFTFINGVPIFPEHDPPTPPSQEGWDFYAAVQPNGWLGHLEDTPGTPGYGRLTFGYWIMNLGLIKKLLPKKDRGDVKTLKFKIKFPDDDQKGVAWEVRAAAVPFVVQKSFPIMTSPKADKGFLDVKKAEDPQVKTGADPKGGGEIEVEITFAGGKDPKNPAKTKPAKVKLTPHVETGGTVG